VIKIASLSKPFFRASSSRVKDFRVEEVVEVEVAPYED
jgi:hypothetical protein